MSPRIYADSSALVKLILTEPESESFRRFLAGHAPALTSRISTIEVPRAIRRVMQPTAAHEALLSAVWDTTTVMEVDVHVARAASSLEPQTLRSLDAIHLASALAIRGELDAFITYDSRLADAARAHGLSVIAPG